MMIFDPVPPFSTRRSSVTTISDMPNYWLSQIYPLGLPKSPQNGLKRLNLTYFPY